MNKAALIIAPILSAGILFGVSSSGFLQSGVPELKTVEHTNHVLTEKGKALLEKEIIFPIRDKRKYGKSEMYSRCPSGVTHYVNSAPTKGDMYYTGRVLDRSGCNSKLVCYFRIDSNDEVLEAKSTEGGTFVPVAEWKKTERATWNF